MKWVECSGQSLSRASPFTRPAVGTAIMKLAKQHGPSKLQMRRCTRLGPRSEAWAVGGFRGLSYQDLSSPKSATVTNVSVASVVPFSACPIESRRAHVTKPKLFEDLLLSVEAMTINYTCRVEEVPRLSKVCWCHSLILNNQTLYIYIYVYM